MDTKNIPTDALLFPSSSIGEASVLTLSQDLLEFYLCRQRFVLAYHQRQ